MFAFDKYMTPFLTPLGAALVLAVLAVGFLVARRRGLAMSLLLIAIAGLYLASTPFVAHALSGLLERDYPPVAVAGSPTADVIIVLGGATEAALPPRPTPGLNSHGDRIVHAADLYKAGKAKWIIASGGNWATPSTSGSEAEDMRDLLVRFGVPADAIVLETTSEDTRQNAQQSATLMQQRGFATVLLVTSGIHMPRAMAAFQHAGVNAIASTADIAAVESSDWPALKWLPSPNALVETGEAIHELAGMLYYKLRGWA